MKTTLVQLNQKYLESIPQFYAPNCEVSTPDGTYRGIEEITRFFAKYWRAFPDSRLETNHIITEGNLVVIHYTFIGTHTGDLAGMPPTKQRLLVPGMVLSRIANGQITEQYFVWDNLGLQRKIWLACMAEKQLEKAAPETREENLL